MRHGFPAAAVAAAALCGCATLPPPQAQAPQAPPARLSLASFADIPGWPADPVEQTLPALQAECHRLALLPVDTALGGQGLTQQAGGRAGNWTAPCAAAGALEPGDSAGIRLFYQTWFQPYRVETPGLVTGYYEPEVRGSLIQVGAYQTPLYARPIDLVQAPQDPSDPNAQPVIGHIVDGQMQPYWTRAQIEDGALGTSGRPLFYLADPVDLFFLQIQGAGRIRLPDGSVMRVGYGGKNGRTYTPIGRVLLAQHALAPDDVNMQSIRAWLEAHRDQARAVMDTNEDYVFFRVLTDADSSMGPPGALGVNLLAGRTAAVDRHAIPLGAPLFIDTTDPVTGYPWQHLVLAQDLGTDIKGAARTDIFLGSGPAAENQAGHMHQPSTEYVLLPRPAA
jgi:membrane-bound lytic murein transglycosylase A